MFPQMYGPPHPRPPASVEDVSPPLAGPSTSSCTDHAEFRRPSDAERTSPTARAYDPDSDLHPASRGCPTRRRWFGLALVRCGVTEICTEISAGREGGLA